jgi:hypothetical protein
MCMHVIFPAVWLSSWDMSFSFHGEVRGEERHGSRDLRIGPGGLTFCISVQVGASEKFKVLPFRVKIQVLALISCGM